jgi:hypothetical protein
MRGADTFTENLFTLRKLEDFVPADHPLCSIRKMANAALAKMDRLFAGMYEADIKGGQRSMPAAWLSRPAQRESYRTNSRSSVNML